MSRSQPESRVLVTIAAIGGALALTVLLLTFVSSTPQAALRAFFLGPFSNRYYLGNMLNIFSTLAITGLGMAIAFRAGVFNLGGEGQLYVSALTATMTGLALASLPVMLGLPIALSVGILTGAVIAGLSGVFRYLWDTDELITSFLIASACIPIVDYLIVGPLKDQASNLLTTERVPEAFRLPRLLAPSQLNPTLIIALLLLVAAYIALFRTVRGYEWRLSGLNRQFARYGGIHTGVYIIVPMVVSGALHGLAGGLFVFGTHYATLVGFTAGLGWNGIAVALIAKRHPLGVIPAAAAFAYLESGAHIAMLHTDFTFELGTIIRAVIFLFVTATVLPHSDIAARMSGRVRPFSRKRQT
ncbi:MAG: ABC transporter permease [Spirochaetia bacterium]